MVNFKLSNYAADSLKVSVLSSLRGLIQLFVYLNEETLRFAASGGDLLPSSQLQQLLFPLRFYLPCPAMDREEQEVGKDRKSCR